MQQHIHAMGELRKRIHATGFYLPESHYCGILIHSLPESWEAVRLSLEQSLNASSSLPDLPPCTAGCRRCTELTVRGLPDNFGSIKGLDWTTTCATLIGEETRRRKMVLTDSMTVKTSSALYSDERKDSRTTGSSTGRWAPCQQCGRLGHSKPKCFLLIGYPVGHGLHDPNLDCRHSSLDCRFRRLVSLLQRPLPLLHLHGVLVSQGASGSRR
jgi:hypothetical protein